VIPVLDEDEWEKVMPDFSTGLEQIRQHLAAKKGSLAAAKDAVLWARRAGAVF